MPHPRTRPAARRLLLLRHGRTEHYQADVFTGWLDVPLSRLGERDAVRAGELLLLHHDRPDRVVSSALTRAVDTARLVIATTGGRAPLVRDARLNERHYGALQGRSRAAVRDEVGDEAFRRWRRSYEHAPPPARGAGSPGGPDATAPASESLADVRRRVEACWRTVIAPELAPGRTTVVVAHSNSLRALCMLLDDLSSEEVAALDVPTGVPLRYDLDPHLTPLRRGGTYLDPGAAAEGLAHVRAQGRRPAVPPHPPSPIEEPA